MKWTAEEDAALRKAWPKGGAAAVRRLLPHRAQWSIYHRRHQLGLVQRKPYWTAEEDAHLALRWNSGDRIDSIAKEMNRPVAGIYERAQKIGLQLGCPPGFEYLTAAARRAGVATATLRKMMRAADLVIHVATTKPRGKQRRKRRHFVDPIDVDDALARWNRTETVAGAARRLGLCPWTLCRKLRALGYGAGRTKKKQHIRVTAEDLKRIGVAA